MRSKSTLFVLVPLCLLLGLSSTLFAQTDTSRILFLGNSYTAFNNLPNLVRQLGQTANRTVIVDSHTPGGATLDQHYTDATALQKIRAGGWDAVVLQEQSQVPVIPFHRNWLMYDYGSRLTDTVLQYNPCTRLVYYMTWGRQNGGQQCDPNRLHCSPVFTDFGHMQDSLTVAYLYMAQSNQARTAPVGEAWRYILDGGGLVLHTSDQSHPNLTGSYLAACVLHGSIWDAVIPLD